MVALYIKCVVFRTNAYWDYILQHLCPLPLYMLVYNVMDAHGILYVCRLSDMHFTSDFAR